MIARKYEPMRLTPVDSLPEGPEWWYEAKLDGYRMMGEIALKQTVLTTRPGNDFTARVPQVAEQLPSAFNGHDVVIDGEMVGLDPHGKENRHELAKARPNAVYYIFDLLEVDGEPLLGRGLQERRKRLEDIFEPRRRVKLSLPFFELPPLLIAAQGAGLEGIVAKRLGSRYRPGRISHSWLKWKFGLDIDHTDE